MLTDSQCRSARCKDKPSKFTDANGLITTISTSEVGITKTSFGSMNSMNRDRSRRFFERPMRRPCGAG